MSLIFIVLFCRMSLRSRSTSAWRSSCRRCNSRCFFCPCAVSSASACGVNLPALVCNCCAMPAISFCSCSMAPERGLYRACMSASAFLISADSSTARSRLITVILGCAEAICATPNTAEQTISGPSPIRKFMKTTPDLACRSLDYHTLFQDPENLIFGHDQVFFALDLDLGTGVLAEQNAVAGLHVDRGALAGIQQLAVAHGLHLRLLRLFLGGIGDDDPADLLFAFIQAFHQHAVMQRT